jgi:hypothetical protein
MFARGLQEMDPSLFFCHRAPPLLRDGAMEASFPIVRKDWWCGEFRPLPQAVIATRIDS